MRQNDEHVADLGDGDFLGEMGIAGSGSRRRGATVIVTAPTDAIAIAGSDFRRMIEEIPALGDAIRVAVAERSHDE